GQTDYCAANAFLDAFAHLPRQWRTLSVAWDSWREVGMWPEERMTERERLLAMTPAEGVEVFRRLLARPLRHALLSTHDLTARLAAANGERIALSPPPAPHRHARPALPNAYVAPRSATEQRIAAAWQETLGVDGVGRHDNFFALGGHS